METIRPGLARVPTLFVNAYFVGSVDGPWAVVDTGIPGYSKQIIADAANRFGPNARPEAILLTHGHFDHAGNAQALADHWNVPIYAHRLEMPYLTGRSDYPPPDPTIGGAIAQLSRVMPHGARDLGTRLRAFTADAVGKGAANHDSGPVPALEGWRWLHTPGHSPGHVVLYHEETRTLLAGDAVATEDMDSYIGLATMRREISTGGSPFICDWGEYDHSLERLAELQPVTLACGHGIPLKGGEVADELERFARHFEPPMYGRYVAEPARVDERGVDWLPPRPGDPFPYLVGAAGLGLVLALALYPRRGE